jgi:hypothetical protein
MVMKFINSFILLCAISVLSWAHEEPSKTLYEKNEKEKTWKKWKETRVKQFTAWKYTVSDGKLPEKGNKAFIQSFDKEGRYKTFESFRNDSLLVRVEYTYDSSGNMLSDIDFSPDGKLTEKNMYVYDHEGRVVSGKFYNAEDQLIDYFTITGFVNKKLITFSKYKTADSIDYRIEYKYPNNYDQSDYTEAIKYNAKNEITIQAKKKYNTQGFTIEKAIYKSDLSLDYTFYYEYDDDGIRLKITKTLADGLTDWYDLYLYDLNRNVSEIHSYDLAGSLKSVTKYVYEYYDE